MGQSSGKSVWSSGEAYEPYVGRWSRLVAEEFLRWLAAPAGARWLDVGCGTGALAGTIGEQMAPAIVLGIDPSEGYLAVARRRTGGQRIAFQCGAAQRLPYAPATFDIVVSGLVLNFVADVEGGLAEMRRVVRPGGMIAAYVWDYADKMELMRYFWDAAVALKPADRHLDEGVRFPLCGPEPLRDLFERTGLHQIEVRAIDIPTHFQDFDDFWRPFLGGQFPAPDYAMSLREDERAMLRERIRASLPFAPDGGIDLIARAWGVRGVA